MWEQRYRVVRPLRTPTNLRIYNDEDLKRLLNISLLNHNGLKISKIARLNENEIKEQVLRLKQDILNTDSQVESLIAGMIELKESNFELLLNRLMNQLGFEDAMTKVVYPFLLKIGVLWQTGSINPAQEHFVSNIIRKKLFAAIDSIGSTETGPKVIMFLPEGELHEISLLFYTYLIKKHGLFPIYLGQSVPLNDIVSVQRSYNANYLFTAFITNLLELPVIDYISLLSKTFKKQKVFITGDLINKLELKRVPNINKIKSPEYFLEELSKIKKTEK
jgi:DNA-binding transcriptional MerR regulator